MCLCIFVIIKVYVYIKKKLTLKLFGKANLRLHGEKARGWL